MSDIRGTVTCDANPEGINQYTGAAGKASAKAFKSNSIADHKAAQKAHKAAAKEHQRLADASAGKKSKDGLLHETVHHSQMVEHHRAMARAHEFAGYAAEQKGKM